MLRIVFIAVGVSAVAVAAHAQYHGSRATPGNCQAAILEAQRNDNVWNAPFSLEDCEAVAAKMIDDGYKAIQQSQRDDNNDDDPVEPTR